MGEQPLYQFPRQEPESTPAQRADSSIPRGPGSARRPKGKRKQAGAGGAEHSGGSGGSSTPWMNVSAGDQVRALVAMLQPAGADLARRWLTALLLVEESDRAALVEGVERRVVEEYQRRASGGEVNTPDDRGEVHVVYPPTQRDGYVETVETAYERREEASGKPGRESRKKA